MLRSYVQQRTRCSVIYWGWRMTELLRNMSSLRCMAKYTITEPCKRARRSKKHLYQIWLSSFFHKSRLIRRIQQNKIYKKFRDLTRNWTQIACLTVRHLNHYTKLFSVPVWGYNWILFMLRWFCPIRLIHLIGRKSLHFEKTSVCVTFESNPT